MKGTEPILDVHHADASHRLAHLVSSEATRQSRQERRTLASPTCSLRGGRSFYDAHDRRERRLVQLGETPGGKTL